MSTSSTQSSSTPPCVVYEVDYQDVPSQWICERKPADNIQVEIFPLNVSTPAELPANVQSITVGGDSLPLESMGTTLNIAGKDLRFQRGSFFVPGEDVGFKWVTGSEESPWELKRTVEPVINDRYKKGLDIRNDPIFTAGTKPFLPGFEHSASANPPSTTKGADIPATYDPETGKVSFKPEFWSWTMTMPEGSASFRSGMEKVQKHHVVGTLVALMWELDLEARPSNPNDSD
ncbi:hypothetical protein C8R46DRAFT_1040883 [Mycena filopes]|nr:hypothetical protein C8R46DRAFT_1040883 [Mycena filopes]